MAMSQESFSNCGRNPRVSDNVINEFGSFQLWIVSHVMVPRIAQYYFSFSFTEGLDGLPTAHGPNVNTAH